MKHRLDIFEFVIEEAAIVLALRSGILVPSEADVERLRRLVDLTVAVKEIVMFILWHDYVFSCRVTLGSEGLHLSLGLIKLVSLRLILTILLQSKHLLLDLRVKFGVAWAGDVDLAGVTALFRRLDQQTVL